MKQIWKAWIGIVLMGIGITTAIELSNFWMLLVFAFGLGLFLLDRNKVNENEKHKQIIQVTFWMILIMTAKDLVSFFFS